MRLAGGSFLCYTLPRSIGPVAKLPALRPDAAGVTFGSFNALAKMTPQVPPPPSLPPATVSDGKLKGQSTVSTPLSSHSTHS